jgi:hypothetical protein
MTMNMASGSFKSTGGSVSVALVVLLVVVMAAETSAQFVSITFANELDAPLTVTVPATELGPSKSTTIAARSDGTSVVFASAVLAANFKFEFGGCVYATAGSIQGRATAETGSMKIFFTRHCDSGEAGLQFLVTIDQGDAYVVANFGCAAPVNPNCAG